LYLLNNNDKVSQEEHNQYSGEQKAMDIKTLIHKSRSCRRFDESYRIGRETLHDLIDLAQHSPSGMNMQPLKFWLSNTTEMNALIFPHLAWAVALKDWGGPAEGERPAAYIIILGDTAITQQFGVNHGIAAQSIMLGAVEKGLGGCMMGSVRREALRQALNIPQRYEILLVLALGKPAEVVVTEPIGKDGEYDYYRDADDIHHVPKRSLSELIVHDVQG
jgi:nitroreductase